MTAPISVIGIDDRPLAAQACRRLEAATLVLGAARHLRGCDVPSAAEQVVLGDVTAALDRLATHAGPAVILASGDPGFFGVVRLLHARGLAFEVFPAASSVSTLCARAGVGWDDAIVMSAHGRGDAGLRRAVNACRAHPKVAVLTAPGSGPAELGAALAGHRTTMLVGERLGTPDEQLTTCSPAEASARAWAEPNVVLVHDDAGSERGWAHPGRQVPPGWALGEDSFEHRDSMVTKAEVRALVLARLAPGLGDLVWDIGCGSGSVAIECARFGAAVSAVDADPEQADRTARNAAAHQVRVHVVTGRAPEALSDLDDPDAVFIGGGGVDLAAITQTAAARKPRVIVAALAALERVAAVTSALRSNGFQPDGVQLSAARLAPLPGDATRLDAQNPVFVLWGER
ncbi:MAG TPA: precorrin-6y C5,15-methyltransferase (decarboxylating) subunit CbiE [Frankiaceae bacterium]|jgi:precorrin-6Y C5,15-methyltransferase (decarboxylating)|nr:precorrin-6y C5,15-methyltransferase (decarboxylating) subunit CbiE [Frankiaceae bacterium]